MLLGNLPSAIGAEDVADLLEGIKVSSAHVTQAAFPTLRTCMCMCLQS